MQKAEDGEIISLNNCIQNYSATMWAIFIEAMGCPINGLL
jgi:hypothetical protein